MGEKSKLNLIKRLKHPNQHSFCAKVSITKSLKHPNQYSCYVRGRKINDRTKDRWLLLLAGKTQKPELLEKL